MVLIVQCVRSEQPVPMSFSQQQHPQICLTDVQGSEYTLVAADVHRTDGPVDAAPGDSDDSLDGHPSIAQLQGLAISPAPSHAATQPSITSGIGRKSSLEIDHHHHQLHQQHQHHQQHHQVPQPPTHLQLHQPHQPNSEQRRDSDKSLAFSDDSLSNDSAQLSPGQDGVPSVASSSGFKSGGDSHSDATCCDPTDVSGRLSPDSLSGSTVATANTPTTSAAGAQLAVATDSVATTPAKDVGDQHDDDDECYELPLPTTCYNLDAHHILAMVKETIDSKMPPMAFVLHPNTRAAAAAAAASVPSTSAQAAVAAAAAVTTSIMTLSSTEATSNLSLEYSGGLQIELQVCDSRRPSESSDGSPSAPTGNMGLKMRRISGDQFEYGKLCQQLISSLTV